MIKSADPSGSTAETKTEVSCAEGETRLNVAIGNQECSKGLGDFIKLWYNFIIGAVGIMATVMIMYAGIKWLTSRGNATVISDSKEKIFAALIGLTIAFLSYTILALINPNLLTIGLTPLPGVSVNPSESRGTLSSADIAPAITVLGSNGATLNTPPGDLAGLAGEDFNNLNSFLNQCPNCNISITGINADGISFQTSDSDFFNHIAGGALPYPNPDTGNPAFVILSSAEENRGTRTLIDAEDISGGTMTGTMTFIPPPTQ